MKKKLLATLMLVGVLALVPTFAFGARSRENTGSGSTGSTSTTVTTPTVVNPSTNVQVQLGDGTSGASAPAVGTTTNVSETGVITSTTGASVDTSETWYRLVVDTVNSNGTLIVDNHVGGVDIDKVEVHFATGIAETAGLPEHIVSDIDGLNSGKTTKEVFGDTLGVDLTNYERVGNTRAVILTDENTGLTNTGTEFILEVSAVEATGTYSIIYYDNHTGRWNIMPVTVDPVTLQIKVYLPGSCTIQLVRTNPVAAGTTAAAN